MLQVTTSPSSEAIVTVSQQVTQSQKESQSKEGESGVAISDQSSGNVNANPLMVSSSPSHPNHQQKHDEIQKTPPTALGTTHQQSQVSKVSSQPMLDFEMPKTQYETDTSNHQKLNKDTINCERPTRLFSLTK